MHLVIRRAKSGLYNKALIRLFDGYNKILGNSKKEYLPFKNVYEIICRNFSLPKGEVMEYLRIFEEFEYISFIRTRGIKLNYIVK